MLIETVYSGKGSTIEVVEDDTAGDVLGLAEGTYGSEQYTFDQRRTSVLSDLDDAISDLQDIAGLLEKDVKHYN